MFSTCTYESPHVLFNSHVCVIALNAIEPVITYTLSIFTNLQRQTRIQISN